MAYTSSGGLKTSTTVKTADISSSSEVDIIIQNQDTAILKLKWGAGCSATDYDVILKACTSAADGTSIPLSHPDFPDSQIISCFSAGTPSYTFSWR